MGCNREAMQMIVDALAAAPAGAWIDYAPIRERFGADRTVMSGSLNELVRRGVVEKRRAGRFLKLRAAVWPPCIAPSVQEQVQMRRLEALVREPATAPSAGVMRLVCRRYVDGRPVKGRA